MKFPKKIIVTLISSATKRPISNLAVFLEIRAARKNNYDIGPRLTDDAGHVIFTEDEVKSDIEWTLKEWIMDYSSKYEECFSDFCVCLPNVENVKRSLDLLKSYKKFDERYARAFHIMRRAKNNNLKLQKWNFNSEKLQVQNGVVDIQCEFVP